MKLKIKLVWRKTIKRRIISNKELCDSVSELACVYFLPLSQINNERFRFNCEEKKKNKKEKRRKKRKKKKGEKE